jgi:hypothetical protein
MGITGFTILDFLFQGFPDFFQLPGFPFINLLVGQLSQAPDAVNNILHPSLSNPPEPVFFCFFDHGIRFSYDCNKYNIFNKYFQYIYIIYNKCAKMNFYDLEFMPPFTGLLRKFGFWIFFGSLVPPITHYLCLAAG